MSKIKLDQELKDEKGNVLGTKIEAVAVTETGEIRKGKNGATLYGMVEVPELKRTLRQVIKESLLDERKVESKDEKEKDERFALWMKVQTAGKEIEFSPEEIVLIKKCINNSKNLFIKGQCSLLLENKPFDI